MKTMLRVGLVGGTLSLACATPEAIDYGDSAESDGSGSTSGGGAAVCGDGIVQDGESCDDGNDDDLDACHDDCTLPGRTVWVTEIPGRRAYHIAPSSDRVYAGGSLDEPQTTDWIGAVDTSGMLIEEEPYPDHRVLGVFVTPDDRLVSVRETGQPSAVEVCVRSAPGETPSCQNAQWEGNPLYVGDLYQSLGRIASVSVISKTANIHEIAPDDGVSSLVTFGLPGAEQEVSHVFTPDGHILAYVVDGSIELQWLDDEGTPGAHVTIPSPIAGGIGHFSIADDARMAMVVRGQAESLDDTSVLLLDADGGVQTTLSVTGWPHDLVFAPNGDLFVLEVTEDEDARLIRYDTDGIERWSRAWADETDPRRMRQGPDGNLYLSGMIWPVDAGDETVTVIRAIEP